MVHVAQRGLAVSLISYSRKVIKLREGHIAHIMCYGYSRGYAPKMIGMRGVFYPWVTVFITVRITEAFGLPKPSLFSKYKVMLLLCCVRVN